MLRRPIVALFLALIGLTGAPAQEAAPRTDYPEATWAPANPGNYNPADRPNSSPVEFVVVHDIEGSSSGCVSWFQNPQARASSHYVVNSITGQVWQMVQEKDVAWHAGNLDYNRRSVGIEHEGYAYRPGFFNPVEYETSAKLIRDITKRWNIARDRQHIIGNDEVPNPRRPGAFGGGSGHTDPGPYWDWDALMTLIRNDATLVSADFPKTLHPGEIAPATVVFENTGDDAWVANSSGREDLRVVEQGGGVYLGTWEPAGRRSPFFGWKQWTSPTMAASIAAGDTAAGSQGTFVFSLVGPRKYGEYTETFRLTKVPAKPKGPVAFGETITATVNVVPWDLRKGTRDAGFSAPGWSPKGGIVWRKAGAGEPATWTGELPLQGEWDVLVNWPAATGRSQGATYEVAASDGVKRIVVNQRPRYEWFRLGRFRFDDPKSVKVSLLADGPSGTLVADSVRFIGPAEGTAEPQPRVLGY
jgi:N-acetyl-anhydromuramyl-L-alanine amidase AmpD